MNENDNALSSSESLKDIFVQVEHQQLVEKIDALEKILERERDHRMEDRFLCLIIVLALLDIILLSGAVNNSIGIVVLVLEIIFILILAKRMGVQQIAGLLDRLLGAFVRKGGDN